MFFAFKLDGNFFFCAQRFTQLNSKCSKSLKINISNSNGRSMFEFTFKTISCRLSVSLSKPFFELIIIKLGKNRKKSKTNYYICQLIGLDNENEEKNKK